MLQSTTSELRRRGTPRASLAALGCKLRQLDLFAPIRERVRIPQKTVKYSPTDKLYAVFIACLAGVRGIVEINQRLRADPALQAAFGPGACAEQSVLQETLDACTEETVQQLEAAVDTIFRQHAAAYRHDYAADWQVLDADTTGMPCGRKAAFATKGYFANERNRRGRQLGRVLASRYGEVVVDRLFDGKTQLVTALVPLVEAAERTLQLEEAQRIRTILRVDAGGGTLAQVNWALARGYQFHGKEYHAGRARKLAASVVTWHRDPRLPERQIGWVTETPTEYVKPVRRIAVRARRPNGQWGIGVLISTLTPAEVLALVGQPKEAIQDEVAVLAAYVLWYDLRGGAVETSVKEDNAQRAPGLGITRRNKKRFAAQQVLVQLNTLAHNVLVWAKRWLSGAVPEAARYGIQRMVRDLLAVAGAVEFDAAGGMVRILLNEADALARRFLPAFQALVGPEHAAVTLGQT
jgi:hypothetical protein